MVREGLTGREEERRRRRKEGKEGRGRDDRIEARRREEDEK